MPLRTPATGSGTTPGARAVDTRVGTQLKEFFSLPLLVFMVAVGLVTAVAGSGFAFGDVSRERQPTRAPDLISTTLPSSPAPGDGSARSTLTQGASTGISDGYAMASPQAITPASAIAPSSSGSLSVPTGLGTAWLAPYGVGGSWNLILNSTFDGGSLASPWQKGWFGTGITSPVNSLEANCYDPSHVTVADGMLSISATQTPVVCNGVQQPWTSGLINTNGNFSFTYGYMEAMLWLPANPTGKLADWPAFWSDGQNWPTTGEIDTIEGLGGDACWHFHSPYGEPGGCAAGGGFTAGWHILGADWEPGSVTYYYDGVAVGQVTQYVTSAPMYLIIDLASVAGATDNVATTMHVAYVRVWQH